jgi:hypothetical protein
MATYNLWTTYNEIDYIRGLVSGVNIANCPYNWKLTRNDRLDNYIKSARRRIAWGTFGGVDGEEVIRFAEALKESPVTLPSTGRES